ncbi:MAG TPA: ATP-binding protein [Candidatus Obscuribacterales bacterium]
MNQTLSRKFILSVVLINTAVAAISIVLAQLSTNIWIIAVFAILSSSIAAFLLSRQFLFSLQSIIAGTRAIAGGNYGNRVSVDGSGDLAQLARDVNSLGERLDQQQKAQKQWMIDTSHELRTPIAILRAQIEAFQDGVQRVTPKTLAILHSEVMALNKLVSDLHELARSDLGEFKCSFVPVDVMSVLQDSLESFNERYRDKNIEVEAPLDGASFVLKADATRLRQLFNNLLENALRYTNPGGKLQISHQTNDDGICLTFDDSPPGVADELLPKIFERFFRGEQSRSRTLGGTGLGLAICQTIVEAHKGQIEAQHSPLGGLRILVRLPAGREANHGQ